MRWIVYVDSHHEKAVKFLQRKPKSELFINDYILGRNKLSSRNKGMSKVWKVSQISCLPKLIHLHLLYIYIYIYIYIYVCIYIYIYITFIT